MNCTQIKYNESLEKLAAIMNPIAKHADVQQQNLDVEIKGHRQQAN